MKKGIWLALGLSLTGCSSLPPADGARDTETAAIDLHPVAQFHRAAQQLGQDLYDGRSVDLLSKLALDDSREKTPAVDALLSGLVNDIFAQRQMVITQLDPAKSLVSFRHRDGIRTPLLWTFTLQPDGDSYRWQDLRSDTLNVSVLTLAAEADPLLTPANQHGQQQLLNLAQQHRQPQSTSGLQLWANPALTTDQALQHLDSLSVRLGEDAGLVTSQAYYLLRANRVSEAARHTRRAMQLEPDNPWPYALARVIADKHGRAPQQRRINQLIAQVFTDDLRWFDRQLTRENGLGAH